MSDPVEKQLDKLLAKWRFEEDFDLSTVDAEASDKMQVRIGGLSSPTVDRYKAAYQRGDVFPPILVHKDGRKAVVVDGNHRRLASLNAGKKKHPAYIITTIAPRKLSELIASVNKFHGLQATEEEARLHALWLDDQGKSIAEIASATNESQSRIQRWLSANRAETRAMEVFGSEVPTGWDSMSSTKKARLSSLTNDAAFEAATRLTCDGISEEALISMVTKVRRARSEARQVEIVKECASDPDNFVGYTGKTKKQARGPQPRLTMALTVIDRLEVDLVAQTITDPGIREELAERCERSAEALLKIQAALS